MQLENVQWCDVWMHFFLKDSSQAQKACWSLLSLHSSRHCVAPTDSLSLSDCFLGPAFLFPCSVGYGSYGNRYQPALCTTSLTASSSEAWMFWKAFVLLPVSSSQWWRRTVNLRHYWQPGVAMQYRRRNLAFVLQAHRSIVSSGYILSSQLTQSFKIFTSEQIKEVSQKPTADLSNRGWTRLCPNLD